MAIDGDDGMSFLGKGLDVKSLLNAAAKQKASLLNEANRDLAHATEEEQRRLRLAAGRIGMRVRLQGTEEQIHAYYAEFLTTTKPELFAYELQKRFGSLVSNIDLDTLGGNPGIDSRFRQKVGDEKSPIVSSVLHDAFGMNIKNFADALVHSADIKTLVRVVDSNIEPVVLDKPVSETALPVGLVASFWDRDSKHAVSLNLPMKNR